MVMKAIGDALSVVAGEFLAIAQKAEAKKMFNPGPNVPYSKEAEKVIAAVRG